MPLIDDYLPVAHFSETHALAVNAPAEAVLASAAAFRPEGDAFFQRMIALRELPMRLGRFVSRTGAEARQPFSFDDFTLLEHGRHEIVYGLAGRFWRSDFGLIAFDDGIGFTALDEPGIAKLALNFAVHATGAETCKLQTQTRVFCTGAPARAAFAPYWYLLRPVSGLIRRRTLISIRNASETEFGNVL